MRDSPDLSLGNARVEALSRRMRRGRAKAPSMRRCGLRSARGALPFLISLLCIANLITACGEISPGPDAPSGHGSAPTFTPSHSSSISPNTTDEPGGYRDNQAGPDSRSIPAWGELPTTVHVFTVSFPSKEGERRLIQGIVEAHQPATTTDEVLMVSVAIQCTNVADGHPGSAGSTENVIRGTSIQMQETFVHVAAATGTTTCRLGARSRRPAPASPDTDPESNNWVVGDGSSLQVSPPKAAWSRTVSSGFASQKLAPEQSWTPIVGKQNVPAGSPVEVISQLTVTSCTAVSGSQDASTGGVNLCEAGWTADNRQGSLVRLDLYVRQFTPGGNDFCMRPVRIGTQTRTIDRWEHHAQFYVSGTWHMRSTSACGGRLAYYAKVRVIAGAQAVVHAPTTRVTLVG